MTEIHSTRWGPVWLLFGVGVVAAFQIGKAPPALPVLRADLGMSLVGAGWALSIFSAAGALIAMLLGSLADRFGHRRMVLGGLALLAAGAVLGSVSRDGEVFLLSRAIESAGFAAALVGVPSLLVRIVAPRDLRMVLALWTCYMPTGTALMILAAPAFIATVGWRAMWGANAAMLLAMMGLVAAAPLARQAAGSKPFPWQSVRATLATPGPWLLGIAFGCYAGPFIAVFGFLPTILAEGGFSAWAAAALTAAGVFVNNGGALAGGVLLSRGVRRRSLLVWTSVAMIACEFVVYAIGLPFVLRYAAVVTLSAVGGLIPTACFAGVPRHAPNPSAIATTTGFMQQLNSVCQTLTPPLLAAVAVASGGWQHSPWVLGLLALVVVGCGFGLGALEHAPPPAGVRAQ